MFFFQPSRPRRFHHEYMFVDERKEQLQELERRARQELEGKMPPSDDYQASLRRRLSGSLQPKVLRHRKNRFVGLWMSLVFAAGVLVLLFLFVYSLIG
ncbi:MAG: ubiquitin carboxyl-hydrolase [Prevotella sp.]|nr:ubiquitin carboxyl-hydrolase [Prevotella sp.]